MNRPRVILSLLGGLTVLIAGGLLFLQHLFHAGDRDLPAHARSRFELTVRAPLATAASLFGPGRQRAWSPSPTWSPQFVHPERGEDIPGAVFRIKQGRKISTWINTAFDLQAGHVQYVSFIDKAMVTLIDLRLSPVGSQETKVQVVVERTALNPSMRQRIAQHGVSDPRMGPEWEAAINGYLAQQPR